MYDEEKKYLERSIQKYLKIQNGLQKDQEQLIQKRIDIGELRALKASILFDRIFLFGMSLFYIPCILGFAVSNTPLFVLITFGLIFLTWKAGVDFYQEKKNLKTRFFQARHYSFQKLNRLEEQVLENLVVLSSNMRDTQKKLAQNEACYSKMKYLEQKLGGVSPVLEDRVDTFVSLENVAETVCCLDSDLVLKKTM